MKSTFVLVLVLLAIIVATVLHSFKSITGNEDIVIVEIDKGLNGMYHILPKNANISIKTFDASYLLCRYILAYPYATVDKNENLDTVINICSITTKDSVLHSITDRRKVIWSNKDDHYQYFLTCNQ